MRSLAALGPLAELDEEVRAAVSFLTRIPVRGAPSTATTGAGAFGLVGAGVGAAAAAAVALLGGVAPAPAAVLGVAAIAAITGALHLDGLADTADALAVGDPARAEAARRDPRVGAAGAAAIVTIVLLDASVIAAAIDVHGVLFAAAACLVAGAGSRAFAACTAPLARGRVRNVGSAAWFADRVGPGSAMVAVASAVLLATVLAIVTGRLALFVGLAAGLALAEGGEEWLIRARGALDGDGIGALVEVSFAAILLATLVGAAVLR